MASSGWNSGVTPIEFQRTPNPDAMRVLPGRTLGGGQTRQFSRQDGPIADPLAAALLAIEGVERVMIGRDFVTVVREGAHIRWEDLTPEIALALADVFEAAETAVAVTAADNDPSARDAPLGEIEQQIEYVLDRWVRPLLEADGGDAVLERFDEADGTAWLRMEGACGGCPSGSITLKRGIEQSIRKWVPEVLRVQAVQEVKTPLVDAKERFRNWVSAKWGEV